MKVYTSYFYQIRNFYKNMLPISTTISNPKWFLREDKRSYLDKNLVLNGACLHILSPRVEYAKLCRGKDLCTDTPDKCKFLRKYKEHLDTIDIKIFKETLVRASNKYKAMQNLSRDPIIVFIVYEVPSNKCSERQVLLDWLNSIEGIEAEELQYPIKYIIE